MIVVLLVIIIFYIPYTQQQDEDINKVHPASLIYHSPTDELALRFLANINNCTCRENPGAVVECFGSLCRKFPSTVPVTAPLFKFRLTSVATIQKNDFQTLSNIEAFEIEANIALVKLVPGCFRNMSKLRNLTMSNNLNLKYLHPLVFEGLINVETFCLSKNGFTKVIDITVALSPKSLPKINLLDISENTFNDVNENDFAPMNGSTLAELNMLICQIKYIHPNCLEPFRHLTALRLGQNLFNRTIITTLVERTVELKIPLDILNLYDIGLRQTTPYALLEAVGHSNISYISLAINNFYYIDDHSFPKIEYLGNLDLRECFITYITSHAFDKLPSLVILLIGGNRLFTIPEAAIINTMTILDLAGTLNDVHTIENFIIQNNTFKNMTAMYNLQLCYNNIGFLTKSTFIGLTNLTILNLKNASLFQIEPGTFLAVPKLLHLNLINNRLLGLMPLTADIFLGLYSLHFLLLGGCSINNLTYQPSIFTYMQNLTYLGLEGNGLHTIAPNQIDHMPFLNKIKISENKLTPWNQPILPRTALLKSFIACHNRFTYITPAMLEDWATLDELYLDDNTFVCDCSLFTVVKWFRGNKISGKYYESNSFIAACVSPEKWRRQSILMFLRNLTADSSDCEYNFFFDNLTLVSSLAFFLFSIVSMGFLAYIYRWHIRYWIFLLRISFTKHNFWRRKSKRIFNCTYKYDAFVSYSNSDRDFVMNLLQMLETNEPYLKLCVYERDFELGASISSSILQSVIFSKRTLLVISNAFAKSKWCGWETQLAEYHQLFFHNDNDDGPDDTLLMIKLEPVANKNLTPTLKYLMKTRIYIEWGSDPRKQELFWDKLRNTLSTPKRGIKNS